MEKWIKHARVKERYFVTWTEEFLSVRSIIFICCEAIFFSKVSWEEYSLKINFTFIWNYNEKKTRSFSFVFRVFFQQPHQNWKNNHCLFLKSEQDLLSALWFKNPSFSFSKAKKIISSVFWRMLHSCSYSSSICLFNLYPADKAFFFQLSFNKIGDSWVYCFYLS